MAEKLASVQWLCSVVREMEKHQERKVTTSPGGQRVPAADRKDCALGFAMYNVFPQEMGLRGEKTSRTDSTRI